MLLLMMLMREDFERDDVTIHGAIHVLRRRNGHGATRVFVVHNNITITPITTATPNRATIKTLALETC